MTNQQKIKLVDLDLCNCAITSQLNPCWFVYVSQSTALNHVHFVHCYASRRWTDKIIYILPLFFLSVLTISIAVNSTNSSTLRFPRTLDTTVHKQKIEKCGKMRFRYVNSKAFGWNALFRDNESPPVQKLHDLKNIDLRCRNLPKHQLFLPLSFLSPNSSCRLG